MNSTNFQNHIQKIHGRIDLLEGNCTSYQILQAKSLISSYTDPSKISSLHLLPEEVRKILQLPQLSNLIAKPLAEFIEEVKKTAALSEVRFSDPPREIPSIISPSNVIKTAVSEGRLGTAEKGEGIYFGTFTSCLGVAVELNDGKKIAIHCVIKPSTRTLKQLTATQLMDQLKEKISLEINQGSTIQKIAVIGFLDWWKPELMGIHASVGKLVTDIINELNEVAPGADQALVAYTNLSNISDFKDGAVVEIDPENTHIRVSYRDKEKKVLYH